MRADPSPRRQAREHTVARALARLAIPAALAATVAVALAPGAAAQPLTLGLDPQDQTVNGTIATVSTFVSVPPGFAVRSGTVNLRFRHSPVLRSSRSTVTLAVDGVALASARLTRRSARAGRLRAKLPPLSPDGGGFSLEARFGMHLTTADCEDIRNPALWARVLAESTIDVRLKPARRTVGLALEQLAPPATGEPISIRLAPAPSAAELAVAGYVAAALGRADAVGDDDPLVVLDARGLAGRTARTTARSDIAGFEVATGARLVQALARIGVRRSLAKGEGILAVARGGPPRLVVGGVDATGLAKASAALTTLSLTRSTARVLVLRRAAPRAPSSSQPWERSAASFEQLGIGTREVVASGLTRLNFPVDRPPSWTLGTGGMLDLVVDPGAGLRADISSLSVDVGGRRLGTRRLAAGRGSTHLRFALPAGLLNRDLVGRPLRSVAVGLGFNLRVPQERCVPADDGAARATLASTSKLTLPHTVSDDRDLARFPAPLAGAGRSVSIVLPRGRTSAELAAGLQVAAAIGRWSEPQAPLPRLIAFDDLDIARERDSLALVGRAGAQLRARTGLPEDARKLGRGEGVLAVRRSPWSPHLTVLFAIGADDSGLARTARALAQRAVVQRLAGSAMHVVPRAAPDATANVVPIGQPPAVLAPVLAVDGSAPEEWSGRALPAAVLLLVVLGAIFVLLARRRRQAARRR